MGQLIQVEVKRSVIEKLRSEAKRCFPFESFSALIGSLNHNAYTTVISNIWIPSDLDKYSTTSSVTQPDHWVTQANHFALEEDLVVLGCAHSHPITFEESIKYGNCLRGFVAPSVGDWECEWSNLAGITAIIEDRYGKLKTLTKFFGPAISCKTRTIK